MVWRFPAGDTSRVGVLCHHGRESHRRGGGLAAALREFVALEGRAPKHGGFLPLKLGRGDAGGAFLVGDAAGLCLPLTGEGIRPALVFGQLAGRLAAQVVASDLGLADVLRGCGRAVRAWAPFYAFLATLQSLLLRVPRGLGAGRGGAARCGFEVAGAQGGYWWAADPRRLVPGRTAAENRAEV